MSVGGLEDQVGARSAASAPVAVVEPVGPSAGDEASHQGRRDDSQRPGDPVGPRHVALGPPVQSDVDDRLGDLLRRRDDPRRHRVAPQLGGREALGLDEPGQHGADVHPVRALLGLEGVGPARQGELRGRVGARPRARDAAGRARDVDDRARARRAQQPEQRLGQPHDGVEVELHRPPHVRVAALGERAAPGGPGVVDEQVESVVVLGDVGGDPLGRVVVDEVDRDPGRRRPELGGERAEAVGAAGDEHELRARLAGQPPRRGLADAARRAGHERDERATGGERGARHPGSIAYRASLGATRSSRAGVAGSHQFQLPEQRDQRRHEQRADHGRVEQDPGRQRRWRAS